MLQYGMRQTGEVVNQLTSVERVMQYTKLDREGPFDTPEGNNSIYVKDIFVLQKTLQIKNRLNVGQIRVTSDFNIYISDIVVVIHQS